MIIFKPEWIIHADSTKGKKQCIYSIDVNSDGKQLATGGLDGQIKIWNTEPVYNEIAEQDPYCQKLFHTLTGHEGAVLCLRWSNGNGEYLASGSDKDNTIIIWKKDATNNSWNPAHKLKGHESDVQGLAWSKDNDFLASCSADGSFIIWNTKTFEQLKKISRHEGRVNGITWDPAGRYLATQSDDETMKIWRISDWTLDSTIRNPFASAPKTASFNRLSWSPDGHHISVTNAINSKKPVATIVEREGWISDVSLVGHQHPVEVAAFNPKMFYTNEDNHDPSSKPKSSICALGSQDRSVSIWVTKFNRPICVAVDIFDNNIFDISWAPDGRSLFACSQDGTVACLQLMEELDDVVPDNIIMEELIIQGYGKKSKRQSLTEKMMESSQHIPDPMNHQKDKDITIVDAPTIESTATKKNGKMPFPSTSHQQTPEKANTLSNAELPGNKRRQSKEEDSKLSRVRPNWTEPTVVPSIIKTSQVRMALPKLKSSLSHKEEDSGFLLECVNSPNDPNAIRAKVTGTKHGSLSWSDCLSSAVVLMTTDASFSAVGCEDGSIHTYSPAGKRLLPAIVLESPAVLLQSSGFWLVCITATGLVYTWDLFHFTSPIEGISIAPIFHVAQYEADKVHDAPSIKEIRIQKNGLPIIITSSHQAFVYHLKMKSWLRVSDAWYIMSEFWGISARKEDHPLAWLSSHNQGPVSSQSLLDVSAATKVVTISHIETQLAVAALLNSPLEYKDWMIYYARRLSEENAKDKVEELCKWLMGPPFSPSNELVKWEPTIMGKILKKDLLQEILPLLSKNRQLQRVLFEFSSLK